MRGFSVGRSSDFLAGFNALSRGETFPPKSAFRTLENNRILSKIKRRRLMPTVTANPLHHSAACATSLPEQIFLLADDLTGACDSAAAFLLHGPRGARLAWRHSNISGHGAGAGLQHRFPLALAGQSVAHRVAHCHSPRSPIPTRFSSRKLTPRPAALLPPKFWPRIALLDRAPSCWRLHFPPQAARCATASWKFRMPPASARRSTSPASFRRAAEGLIALVSRPEELAAALDNGQTRAFMRQFHAIGSGIPGSRRGKFSRPPVCRICRPGAGTRQPRRPAHPPRAAALRRTHIARCRIGPSRDETPA